MTEEQKERKTTQRNVYTGQSAKIYSRHIRRKTLITEIVLHWYEGNIQTQF